MKRSPGLTTLLLTLAVLFGLYVRIYPVVQAGFPILDGGLFYTMSNDLVEAGFRLPLVTTYNHLDIPYTYPPLALYLTGLLHVVTHIELIDLIRWLPVLFSLGTIPAFYLLAREILERSEQAALATLIFSMLPRSYEWLIMGGGITRAPAALFLILMAWATYRAFQDKNWKAALLAGVFGGLILLTHPERALHAAATGLLFWIWLDRSRQGACKALVISILTLTVCAPWWLTILSRNGVEPFLLAAQSAGVRWLFWAPILQMNFTDELIPIVALLAVLGIFIAGRHKMMILGVWFLLTFLVDPRSAPHVIPMQASLLAALALSDYFFPTLLDSTANFLPLLKDRLARGLFIGMLVLMIYNAQMNVTELGKLVISQPDLRAIEWVNTDTAAEGKFLVLDWQETPMLSPLQEWFPALTTRSDVVTIQGREWLSGDEHYNIRLANYPELFSCLYQDVACLESWATANGEIYDYVYLSLRDKNGEPRRSRLADSLLLSSNYALIYGTEDVLIFQHAR